MKYLAVLAVIFISACGQEVMVNGDRVEVLKRNDGTYVASKKYSNPFSNTPIATLNIITAIEKVAGCKVIERSIVTISPSQVMAATEC